jgi:hypothetical protein
MKHRIEEHPCTFRRGTNLIVRLEFTPDEHRIIKRNNMERLIIVPEEPSFAYTIDEHGKKKRTEEDNNLYFKQFYKRSTSWHADSNAEAKELHAKIFEGLKQFQSFLALNAEPGEHSDGDFELKPPASFDIDLVPEYMWQEHAYVLAESGGGKTQLLQSIFLQNMQKKRPPGFVIIDSQGQMLPLIKRKFPNALYIDPKTSPINLDLFNLDNYGSTDLATLLDTFTYLFEKGGQPLTGRQHTTFTYGIALMLFGYPAAFNAPATIDDFLDYFTGEKKGKELSARAHQAASTFKDNSVITWYYDSYRHFDEANAQVLQRLSNICGPFAPLRPLFKPQEKALNFGQRLEAGEIILIDTNLEYLKKDASSFFGRFFFKLLEQQMHGRNERSHPVIFIVDEVQEYFSAPVLTPFLNQARKRNIQCIFAHQRLSQLDGQTILKDALTGVAATFATNLNRNDVPEVSKMMRADPDILHSWRKEYVEGKRRPTYADFGLYLKGKDASLTARLQFGQLEKFAKKDEYQSKQEESHQQEEAQQQKERQEAPIDDSKYDSRYDILDIISISPLKAKRGYVLTVTCPNRRTHLENIPPDTKSGYTFCVKHAALTTRPDGKNGHYWVKLEFPAKEDF